MRNYNSISPQTIYKNALPIYKNRIDLSVLDEGGEDFAENFLSQLFSQSLDIQTSGTKISEEKLQHLYFETRNSERIQGQKTFGLGYPLILLSGEDKLTVAPLFIWSLTLDPDPHKPNTWNLRSMGNRFTEVNERLLRYLEEHYNYDGSEEIRSFISSGDINRKSLKKIGERLENKLGLSIYGSAEDIIPAPGIDVIGALPEKGGLQWSGVLGIFPPQVQSTAKMPEANLIEELKPRIIQQAEETHPFGKLTLNPHQATAYHELRRQKALVIEGKNHSGKTHLLVHLLTNILSNGQKCLVVSDSVEALKKTQNQLSKIGIYRNHYLLKDTRHDKIAFLEILRSAAGKEPQNNGFEAANFEVLLGQTKRLFSSLSSHYEAVQESVFGEQNRTELVGQYLRCKKDAGHELLNSKLNARDFSFIPEEFESLKNGIYLSHVLYEKVNTLQHPLDNIHPHVFTERSQENAKQYITHRCEYFLEKAEKLQKDFISNLDIYANRLKEYYDLYFREFTYRLRNLQEKITDNEKRFGTQFSSASKGSLKLQGLFSNRQKEILNLREEIKEDYASLQKAFAERKYFDFNFTGKNNGFSSENIIQNISNFTEALQNWRQSIPTVLEEEMKRLSAKNAHPKLKFGQELIALEQKQDKLTDEVNGALLYKKSIDHQMLTLHKRQKFCEALIERLEDTLRNLRDFPVFFKWQKNWLSQSPLSQKVIAAMAKTKPNNWTTAFESWYFHQALEFYRNEDMPTNDKELFKFGRQHRNLQELLLLSINDKQEKIQQSSLNQLRKKDRKTYNLLFSKNGSKQSQFLPFSEIVERGLDSITDVFPILFTGLQAAKDISYQQKEYFDYIFFVESNHLKPEDISDIIPAGKRISLFTDPFFENEFSFGDFLKDNEVPAVNLSGKFSGLSGKSAHSNSTKTGISVVHVEGRFKEKAGINEGEIQQIVKILSRISQSKDRTLPSVGIITFTKSQRDAVSNYLLRLKQNNGPEAEKIQQLERNGLGVFFIEEILGQNFDRLIVSLTFGSTSLKGRLGKRIKYLDSPAGLQGIKYLISKSLQKTDILNSIPEDNLQEFLDNSENNGSYYLAQLLTYAESISRKDFERAEAHHALLWEKEEDLPTSSIFRQEARHILKSFFRQGRVLQKYKQEETEIPLCIAPINEEKSAFWLHPDGFIATTPQTSFDWELQQRRQIEAKNIHFQAIWSTNWWKNAEVAAGKLAAKVIKEDKA
jgi:hypothetical protein